MWHLPVARPVGIKQGVFDRLDDESAAPEDRTEEAKCI